MTTCSGIANKREKTVGWQQNQTLYNLVTKTFATFQLLYIDNIVAECMVSLAHGRELGRLAISLR